jgi:hypothetical protein
VSVAAPLTIRLDPAQERRLRRELGRAPGDLRRARDGAVRDTARPVRTAVRKAIGRDTGATAAGINRHLFLRYRSTPAGLSARVTADPERMPLKRFSPRRIRSGVSVLGPGKRRRKIPSAFRGGDRLGGHVFRRAAGGEAEGGLVGRLPIVLLRGPSAGHAALNSARVREITARTAPRALERNLGRRIRHVRLLRERGGR